MFDNGTPASCWQTPREQCKKGEKPSGFECRRVRCQQDAGVPKFDTTNSTAIIIPLRFALFGLKVYSVKR